MPSPREKICALLATGRIANLPTVCSNVLVGFWLSSSLVCADHWEPLGHDTRVFALLLLMLPCCLIYVAGCMLGDAVDYNFDLKNRADRPLPRGILTVHGTKRASYLLFALALIVLAFANHLIALVRDDDFGFTPATGSSIIQVHEILLGLLLTAVVIAYALHHKKNRVMALIMMGSCRFLLVVLAMAFTHKTYLARNTPTSEGLGRYVDLAQSWIILPAFAVAAYTVLLSWVASTESRPGVFQARKILSIALLTVPAGSMIMVFIEPISNATQSISYVVALILCYLWICYGLKALKESKPLFVSRALAGFCLLDATYLAAIEPVAAAACLLLFAAALALQKVAPAT